MKEQIEQGRCAEESALQAELDKIQFEILTNYPSFKGMLWEQYKDRTTRERTIARDPNVREASLDQVMEDLRLYGENPDTMELFIQTFLYNTHADSRMASICGRHGKVVYFATGIVNYDETKESQLGLVSAHAPGRCGTGGHGLGGVRRICHAYPIKERITDPEEWLKMSALQASDFYGDINYLGRDRDVARALFGTILFQKTKLRMKGGNENNDK